MDFQIIALDIDGTLTDDRKKNIQPDIGNIN